MPLTTAKDRYLDTSHILELNEILFMSP